jgi:chromosome segregation ATPase
MIPYCIGERMEQAMSEEPDLRFLGEQMKRLQGDVRLLKSDMAQVRADSVKVESDVAAVKADIARVETKLEVFRESVDDRFDQTVDLVKSSFATLSNRIDAQTELIKAESDQIDTILTEIKSLKRT